MTFDDQTFALLCEIGGGATTTPDQTAAAAAATTTDQTTIPIVVGGFDQPAIFLAVTDGQKWGWSGTTTWNGWACPRFDFETACAVGVTMIGLGVLTAYDPERDVFITLEQSDLSFDELADYERPDEIWAEWPRTPDGRYAIGAFAWTWDHLATVAEITDAFVGVLAEWLSPDELAEVRRRNAAETDPYVCHSHDFCDANMAMLEALVRTHVLSETEAEHPALDNITPVWNAAWALAIAGPLSDGPRAAAQKTLENPPHMGVVADHA